MGKQFIFVNVYQFFLSSMPRVRVKPDTSWMAWAKGLLAVCLAHESSQILVGCLVQWVAVHLATKSSQILVGCLGQRVVLNFVTTPSTDLCKDVLISL